MSKGPVLSVFLKSFQHRFHVSSAPPPPVQCLQGKLLGQFHGVYLPGESKQVFLVPLVSNQ